MAVATLTRFEVTRPQYEVAQERLLAWIAHAHALAEATREHLDDAARAAFEEKLARVIRRVACSPDKIARRGQSVADVDTFRFDQASIYDVAHDPCGKGSEARTQLFAQLTEKYFAAAYASELEPPDELVHVTCTGYSSPSGAQRMVASRGWPTRVTHAYHMGCYASIPALRIAAGSLALGSQRVDVAHTELCSLHADPANHALEQLVVQSLFADGFVRYTLVPEAPGLRVLALHERLMPDSADAMTWVQGDHGMRMTLSRDVPDRVAGSVRAFVIELFARASLDERIGDSVFAVHPGGPKIIDRVQDVLLLHDAQVATSRGVLHDHGNMSSATLPHIWARLLADPEVRPGTLIPSLAFGPGLSLCGALLQKC